MEFLIKLALIISSLTLYSLAASNSLGLYRFDMKLYAVTHAGY